MDIFNQILAIITSIITAILALFSGGGFQFPTL
jgi:hypothetical protein